MYYAITWIAGRAVWGNSYSPSTLGMRAAYYHSFETAAARDLWVSNGKGISTRDADFRESIPASDSELRNLQRRQERAKERGEGETFINTSSEREGI